ncbi:MAG: cytochrome c3 family protein [Planctomycetota bacterium]|nr:cytochrome c3 family protein [Planctomycetota bacterium]
MKRLLVAALVLVFAAQAFADEESDACFKCHGDPAGAELRKVLKDPKRDIQGLILDKELWARSMHAEVSCTDCHEGVDEFPHAAEVETTACADCHDEAAEAAANSVHSVLREDGSGPRASCLDCHGVHGILPRDDRQSAFHPLNVHMVCGKCHFSADPATLTTDQMLAERYSDDDHAHGILHGGLTVAPTCVTCHGGHETRASGDPASRVARHNVDQLCGSCHVGALEDYRRSAHFLKSEGEEHKGATCTDCHKPHDISAANHGFLTKAAQTCAGCHEQRGGTFRLSYHGKVASLGELGFGTRRVATCDSCHGNHAILPADHPESTIHPDNVVATCATCHEGSHPEFAAFLVHADPADGENFPRINFFYVVMNTLLIGTLLFGCLHALLWLIRSLAAGEHKIPKPAAAHTRWYRRWPRSYVVYHIWMMVTVLGLAVTGFPIHYADMAWAQDFMSLFGGASIASFVHRVGAVSLALLFVVYGVHVLHRIFRQREKGMFDGGNTMLPRMKDLKDLWGNIKWFLFLAPRPKYDRWTYWEKFDFWAATWGLFVIGLTGLMLWFPEQATHFVPGWFLNVAVVVHGIEALLDIAFIFTVHVFHANLRPDKFPMDTMFLTGVISEEEFKHERPAEYERAVREGKLEELLSAKPPSRRKRAVAYLIGSCALAVGFFFVGAMIVAVLEKLT